MYWFWNWFFYCFSYRRRRVWHLFPQTRKNFAVQIVYSVKESFICWWRIFYAKLRISLCWLSETFELCYCKEFLGLIYQIWCRDFTAQLYLNIVCCPKRENCLLHLTLLTCIWVLYPSFFRFFQNYNMKKSDNWILNSVAYELHSLSCLLKKADFKAGVPW